MTTTSQIVAQYRTNLNVANTQMTAVQSEWAALQRNMPASGSNVISTILGQGRDCDNWAAWGNQVLSLLHTALNVALTSKYITSYVAGIPGAVAPAKSYETGAADAYSTCAQALANIPSNPNYWDDKNCAILPSVSANINAVINYAITAMTYAFEAVALPIPTPKTGTQMQQAAQGAGALVAPFNANQRLRIQGLPGSVTLVQGITRKGVKFTGALDAQGNYIPVVGASKATYSAAGAFGGAALGALIGLAFKQPGWAGFIGAIAGAGAGFTFAAVSDSNADSTNTSAQNTLNAL